MEKKSFEPAEVYNLKDAVNFATGGVVSKQFIKNKGGNITFFAFDSRKITTGQSSLLLYICRQLRQLTHSLGLMLPSGSIA